MESFPASLLGARQIIDAAFLSWLEQSSWHDHLKTLSKHVLVEAGKCVRPALVFASYNHFSGNSGRPPENVIQAALALEMVHTYSLVHDDLPAMDNDDVRRGRPTLHRIDTEASAILAGDALLTGAFEVLASLDALPRVTLAVSRELAIASGGAGMVGGQIDDMRARGFEGIDFLDHMHRMKTGALFGCSLAMGSLLAADRSFKSERHLAVRKWGIELGLVFQIVDDLLDDEPGKLTYRNLLGDAKSRERVAHLSQELLATAENCGIQKHLASTLVEFFVHRKA